MRKLSLSVLFIGLVMLGIAGCPKTQVTGLPQNVSENQVQAWYTATGAVKVIAESTQGLTKSVIALHDKDEKLMSANDYQNILVVLGKTAQAGLHVDSVLRKAPSNFGKGTKDQIMAEIQPIVAELKQADMEGIFSKSQSPQMQAELAAVQLLTESANTLLALAK